MQRPQLALDSFLSLVLDAKESGRTHPSLEKTSERFEGENRCRCGSKELKEHKRVETESES